MAFQGMTGIASVAGRAWTWNARSVNGKGLDVRCRVPGGLEWLEPVARERAGRLMTRGSHFALPGPGVRPGDGRGGEPRRSR